VTWGRVNLLIFFDIRVRYVKKVENHCARLSRSGFTNKTGVELFSSFSLRAYQRIVHWTQSCGPKSYHCY